MIQNRREYLHQQRLRRLRRRRIFTLCCLAFFVTILVLLCILIGVIAGRSDESPADSAAESSVASIVSDKVSDDQSSALSDSAAESSLVSDSTADQVVIPDGYELLQMTEDDMHKGNLLLINKDYKYWFSGQQSMTAMYDLMGDAYSVNDIEVKLADVAAEPANSLLTDFYNSTGLNSLTILCGYRSEEMSQELYDQSVIENGQEHADWYVMPPGHSEHQAALAFDLWITYSDYSEEFTGEGDYAWVNENCHKYGFILRYPDAKKEITQIAYEPWHFRYLGVPNATAVVNTGLCYEEYIEFIKDYTAAGQHYQVSTADGNYEIYYAPGLEVPVPSNQSYEISGNNVDGFIVTVKIS